ACRAVSGVVIREDSRFECLGNLRCVFQSDNGDFGGPPYRLHFAVIVVCLRLVFGSLLLSAYSIRLDLSKRSHPLAAGSASLETAPSTSARASSFVPVRS